jgi:hypothetical protein
MRPETRNLVYNLTIDEVGAELNLSARAVAALVEDGLLSVVLPQSRQAPALNRVRFRKDQVNKLLGAERELIAVRDRYPRRTRDYDRAIALGALLGHLYR